MQFKLIAVIASTMLAAAATFGAEGPTTSPAVSPITYSLHGKVEAGAGIDLHKVDLTRVVIYLDSDPVLDATPIPAEHPSVIQKNKEFVPKFIVVPNKSVVEFPNWDHIAHNVFSRSAAAPAFDLEPLSVRPIEIPAIRKGRHRPDLLQHPPVHAGDRFCHAQRLLCTSGQGRGV